MAAFFDAAPGDTPAPLVTATVGLSGGVHAPSRGWNELFGTLAGAPWARVLADDRPALNAALDEARAGYLVGHVLVRVARPLDEPVPLLVHALPVRGPAGETLAVQVLAEALTDPAALPTLRTRRERFVAVGRMAMGIVHDLNNLLATVLGHGELAEAEPHDLASVHLGPIMAAARDGAHLVGRLQRFMRQEKAESFEPVDLGALARDVVALTRPHWHHEARRRGVHLVVEVDADPVPPMLGSPVELREVLVNLVLNAVHAMPQGGRLHVGVAPVDSGQRVQMTVSDTGVGMDDETLRHAFEPLFTTKGETGTGVGLSVARGIVEAHGGHVEVESAPGRGTSFTLTFPAVEAPVAAAPAVGPPAPAPAAAERRTLRVLFVDDEPRVRTVGARLLALRGHTVDEAGSGHEALDRLADLGPGAFDVVLTDFGMPGMDGLTLAERIRHAFPALPVVLLTGDTEAGRAAHDGVAAVLTKPFRADALDAALQAAVAAAAPTTAAPPSSETPPGRPPG